jgi:hypothetical protein
MTSSEISLPFCGFVSARSTMASPQSLRRTLVCLLELDRPATLAEMAILTEADRASAQDAMLELQRRSLVVIGPGLTDSMAQAYELGSMAREYLLNQAPVDAHFQADLRRRIAEIQAHEDIRQRQERDIVLKPTAVFATSLEERAAATLLRQSLRSYRSDLEAAREQVDRAKDAAPHFFESYRVSAFIESSNRPEEATRQYEESRTGMPDTLRDLAEILTLLSNSPARPTTVSGR